ncbi:MAG: hypothetical protein ACTSR8_05970 [Promethearchaeota archaeon]
MSEWENLYSEVRKRKLEALNKKKVVKKVEKTGGFLALDGKYEKTSLIFQYIYAKNKKILEGKQIERILDWDLTQYDLILIGCPGLDVPREAYPKLKEYVSNGGWLLTTDWVIQSIIEKVFPGFIAPGKDRTEDVVVECQILKPNHPFLEGVIDEISLDKWADGETDFNEFKWWLEYRSFPIKILRPRDVNILIASWEIKEKWGEAPVLVYFNYGLGRIIHMISHTVLQKSQDKGKYASALIITNILDEAVANRDFRKKKQIKTSKTTKASKSYK